MTAETTDFTPADVALLAAHCGWRFNQDKELVQTTYQDAQAYLAGLTEKRRAGLIRDLWRRYGPPETQEKR